MILATTLLVSLSVLMSSKGGHASSMESRQEQEAYLKRYAYMGPLSPDPRFASITDPNEMFHMAVMKFQMMAGINETGVVDDETMKMMEMPRCGLPDEVGMSMVAKRRRRRRYAANGGRWRKTRLTYRINNYTPDLSQNVIDSEIQTAFKSWSDSSPLTFTKVTDKAKQADIKISFGSRNHGDKFSFDGSGGVLAHAFSPQSGEVHFDEDELWTSKTKSGTNFLQVAIHEFGHALGLSHSDVKGSIMLPYYAGYVPDVRLHSDDIAGIRYIYGSMMRQVQTTQRSTLRTTRSPSTRPIPILTSTTRMPPSAHDICRHPTVDAIFAVNEDVYVFKDHQYYMGHRYRFLSPARPISADWQGLPNNIDTAVYLNGYIVFFKGHQFWRYNSSRQPEGQNPQPISTAFSGLWSKIDAAFVWSGNGKLYVISGDKYYRLSKRQWISNSNYRVDFGYPQPLRIWKGLPSKIDAAFKYTNGRTYFFSNSSYYRFNDVSFKVDSGYPKSTADNWLGCSDRMGSDIKSPGEDMMEKEWMAGGDQFMTGGVGLLTHSVLMFTIAMLASCLLFP